MSQDSFLIIHNQFQAEIDSKVFGHPKLLIAQIRSGFWGEVNAIAKKIAMKLLKETWKLPELAKDKAYVEELTAQTIKSFTQYLEGKEGEKSLDILKQEAELPKTEPQMGSVVPIPSSAVMFSSMEAYLRKDLWKQDKNGIAYLQHIAKSQPKNYLEHYITSPGDITFSRSQTSWLGLPGSRERGAGEKLKA
jgi:hypothetical protein